ncbi:MAG: hypothetical protein ABWW69_03920 [Pyrodictiaceae archaeon]
MRGLSPYVSAILLTLIVLVVGGMIVANTISIAGQRYQDIERRVLEIEHTSRQDLGLLASYIDSQNNLRIYLATGDYPVKILAVYVDGVLYTSKCSFYTGNTTSIVECSPPCLAPAYTMVIIKCSGVAKDIVSYRVVYEGGAVEHEASR